MEIDKLDKIILSKEEMDNLFLWRDNHKDYVRSFKPVLEKGCIEVYIDGKVYHKQVFEKNDKGYLYSMYYDDKVIYMLQWFENKTAKVFMNLLSFNEQDMFEYNQSCISLHASIMAYMEYYSDKREYVEVEDTTIRKKKKKAKKQGAQSNKKSKRYVKIKKKVYKVSIPNEAVKLDRKRYERKIEKWNVRGHYRQLKNGQRVWIKPHVRGEGKEVNPKNYKL